MKIKNLFSIFIIFSVLLFSISLAYPNFILASTISYDSYVSAPSPSMSNSIPAYENLCFENIERAIINSNEQDGVIMIDIINTKLVKKGNGAFTLTLPKYFTWKNLDAEVIEGDIEITKSVITNTGKTFNVNVKKIPTERSVLYLYFSINSSKYNHGDTLSAKIGGKSCGKLKGKYVWVGDF